MQAAWSSEQLQRGLHANKDVSPAYHQLEAECPQYIKEISTFSQVCSFWTASACRLFMTAAAAEMASASACRLLASCIAAVKVRWLPPGQRVQVLHNLLMG